MGRAPCCSKEGLYRGPWSTKEDMLLTNYIRTHGAGKWRSLPKRAGLLRCGKSCRLRWLNYLRPGIKRGNITPDEEDLIIRLQSLLGNRWSLIAGRLPGRTDNEIKNHWNTHLLKRLKKAGIEPKPHKYIAKRAREPERKIKNSPTTTRAPKKQIGLDDKSEKDDAITIGEVGLPKPIRVSSGFTSSCNSAGNAGTDSVESVGSSSQLQQLEPDKEAKTKLIPSYLPWSPFHLEDASNVHDQMNPLRDEEDETLLVDCDLSSLQDGALLEKVYDEYLQLL